MGLKIVGEVRVDLNTGGGQESWEFKASFSYFRDRLFHKEFGLTCSLAAESLLSMLNASTARTQTHRQRLVLNMSPLKGRNEDFIKHEGGEERKGRTRATFLPLTSEVIREKQQLAREAAEGP